mgnify:FL=1
MGEDMKEAVKLELTRDMLVVLLKALGELPLKMALPVYLTIQAQERAQRETAEQPNITAPPA